MILNIELTIKITNDGKNINNTDVFFDKNQKVFDALTALEMGKESVLAGLETYITAKYGSITEKQYDEISKNLTFEEMYEQPI